MRKAAPLALALMIGLAACADGPTEPDTMLAPETAMAKASGAQDDPDLADWDENDNGWVCVKTVPASGKAAARAGERTIVKDDSDEGTCPGGFTREELEDDGGGIFF